MLIIVTVIRFWYSGGNPPGGRGIIKDIRSSPALAYLHYARSGKFVGLSLDWKISIFTIRNPHSTLGIWKVPETIER